MGGEFDLISTTSIHEIVYQEERKKNKRKSTYEEGPPLTPFDTGRRVTPNGGEFRHHWLVLKIPAAL